jgi:hypothetical protein
MYCTTRAPCSYICIPTDTLILIYSCIHTCIYCTVRTGTYSTVCTFRGCGTITPNSKEATCARLLMITEECVQVSRGGTEFYTRLNLAQVSPLSCWLVTLSVSVYGLSVCFGVCLCLGYLSVSGGWHACFGSVAVGRCAISQAMLATTYCLQGISCGQSS